MTRIAAALSRAPATAEAAADAAARVRAELGDAGTDLAYLFLSPHHLDGAEDAVDGVGEALAARFLLGCVAEGVVAGATEVEEGPAAAVWAASLPGAAISTFHATTVELEDGIAIAGFPGAEGADLVTLLVDPYTFPADGFLARLNEENPGLPLVGGIAVGGEAGEQRLIVDGEIVDEGAVGAVVSGVPVRTVVSQGCAPIGREAVVTAAEGNIVYELAGERPLARLRADIAALDSHERALAAQGLLVGLVIDENKAEYGRGDYLMRGVLGADEESGAIAVGAAVRVGQTIRFHVRDAATADEDLRDALAGLAAERAAGALLFTCNGRGTRMFSEPGHDARAVAEAIGAPTLAGFFCGGEIGPVGGRAFLHGFTATLAVFLER